MSIHKRIKQRREHLGLSMQALADLVGVSAWQTIQQWEKEGGTAPKRERLHAVAKALQTSPEALLFGPAEEHRQSKSSALQDVAGTEFEGLSMEAQRIAKAFDRLNPAQRAAVKSQLTAFGCQL
ncbi:MAG: repressor [Herminiimonas sp.]|nr:repressor [Herminiimonas sp.]